MPGFDQTGPHGRGPLTGKKRGYCAGNETEILKGRIGLGRGYRWGLSGSGSGRAGWGWRWHGVERREHFEDTDRERIESEIMILKEQISHLEKKLKTGNNDEKKQAGNG